MVAGGIGYDDLNKLLQCPQTLEFIFELIKVEQPGQYEQENWQLNEEDRKNQIPKLKEQGNEFYQGGEYAKAVEKYRLALHFIDQLQLKQKPRDTEWNELNAMKVPFLLNIAQCFLCTNEFYPAIQQCNEVLQIDDQNVKAFFRRGKSYLKTWNTEEAKEDFDKVLELDPSQKNAVNKLLLELKETKNQCKEMDKSMMKNIAFK